MFSAKEKQRITAAVEKVLLDIDHPEMPKERTTFKLHVMPEFSQGVCEDGAALLMDGKQLTIEEILSRLRRGATAERIVCEMWDMFYGQNMEVANWHLNGDLEPIDSFFDNNDWSIDEA